MEKNFLEELEKIKLLKAKYFRLMDTQQWDEWANCFTDNVIAVYEGAPRRSSDLSNEISISGKNNLVDGVKTLMTGACSMHQGFMPELCLEDSHRATGIWSMFDYVRLPTCHFKGWGHYHEEYLFDKDSWKISRIHLTRLHTEEDWV